MLYADVMEEIIKCFYKVYNTHCKATNVKVGLLLNFGKSPEVKRVAFSS